MLGDPLAVVARVGRQLTELGIDHYVVGSLASSVYGIPRATQDVDLVAVVKAGDAAWFAKEFASALADEFYVDEESVCAAVSSGGSFNLIHLATMFKADVFLAGSDEWASEQIRRSLLHDLEGEEGPFSVRIASPEDTILHKLHWYRLGDETSERQWRDVLGVLRIQGADLDESYLVRFATVLRVSDLLSRARAEM